MATDFSKIVDEYWNEETTGDCDTIEEEAYEVAWAAGIEHPAKEDVDEILDEMDQRLRDPGWLFRDE